MAEIYVASLLYVLLGLPIIGMLDRPVKANIAMASILLTLVLAFLAGLNLNLSLVEQKFASEFSFDIYLGRESLRDQSGFILQYIFNLPAFLLTNVWWAAIGTNVAITALLFAYVANHDLRLAPFALAPAIINFSLFSLRDPLIMVLFLYLALCLSNFDIRQSAWRIALVALAFLFIRPENISIMLVAIAAIIIYRYRNTPYVPFLTPIGAVAGYVALIYAPSLLGIQFFGDITSLADTLDTFYIARADRWDVTQGGGSNILGGALTGMPLVLRYPIQMTAFFILPLPFEIDSVALALAFVDSIVFCYLFYRFLKAAPVNTIILAAFYIAAAALFMNNYGNAFRIRLPVYGIMLAGLIRTRLAKT